MGGSPVVFVNGQGMPEGGENRWATSYERVLERPAGQGRGRRRGAGERDVRRGGCGRRGQQAQRGRAEPAQQGPHRRLAARQPPSGDQRGDEVGGDHAGVHAEAVRVLRRREAVRQGGAAEQQVQEDLRRREEAGDGRARPLAPGQYGRDRHDDGAADGERARRRPGPSREPVREHAETHADDREGGGAGETQGETGTHGAQMFSQRVAEPSLQWAGRPIPPSVDY
ncbi:hypothetical protein [Microtetraspora malaysiensis]|uniref:Uncharacterized protein n=1 Tax=Microtetraspora malaysiensis TaxID=161358 RepID=A0ABW6SSE1_9ACTN